MKIYYLLLIFMGIIITTSCSDDGDDDGTMTPAVTNYKMSVSASSTAIMEDGGTANLTVTLDKVNQGDAIPFSLEMAGQATHNEDYELTGEKTISKGSQSTTLTLNAINDSDVEDDETIMVTLQENLENIEIENGTVNLIISDEDMVQSACMGTSDTYLIDLNASNCTVDIESVLGINSLYNEQVSGSNRVINTNAIPNHKVGQFPNMGNPHTITEIHSSYSIAVSPTANSSVTLLTNDNGFPHYRFGVLFNGILLAPIAAEFFTNTQTGDDNTDWNENALSSDINLGTDCNNSHVFPSGMYHHHATPSAYIASMNINGSSPVQIGWAADGYPIYYKYGNKNGSVVELVSGYRLKTEDRGGDGISAPDGCPNGRYTQDYEYLANLGDLDECNGYQDPQLGYIYVITDTYPSIPRCFTATPSNDFRNN